MSGIVSYQEGLAAEHSVALKYKACGFEIVEQRFKTSEGEIDLIAKRGSKIYFIEVKKSTSFDRAVEMIKPRQVMRIKNTALLYLQKRKIPLETEMRFDAALVNGLGQIKVIPNAFS